MSCHNSRVSMSRAIQDVKMAGLTEFPTAKNTVPYFQAKTLTPVWDFGETNVKVPDFNLVNQSGKVVDQKVFDKKISLVFFFFTTCAGICPNLIQTLKKISEPLREFSNVQYVGFSLDPDRDSPEALQKYRHRMKIDSDRFTLVTGNRKTIYALAHDTFAAEAFPLPKTKGQIGHTERFFVVDEIGFLRGAVRGTRLDSPQETFLLVSQLHKSQDANQENFERFVVRKAAGHR